MECLKIGIIGVGNMGTAHLKCIMSGKIKGMTLGALCDTDKKRIGQLSAEYPDIAVYESYEELLKSSDVDSVIISVPHPMHSVIAIRAFECGKNVLTEKPGDVKASAVRNMMSAAEKSGKTFGIMFNQRTNGLFQKAREIVKSGFLGELKRSVWIVTNWYRTQSYYNSGGWRATWSGEGGGVLLNQAPHNLDLWQWICGMPNAVTAFCNVGKFHDIEVEDEATIYAEYENGATGVFITSTGDCPGTNRFEISGTRGKLVLEEDKLKLWRLKEDEREVCRNSELGYYIPENDYSEFTAEKETAHAGILQNFADAVISGEELLAPGYDALNELMISNAAYLSQWKGNAKISLPFNEEEFDKMLAEKAAESNGKNQEEHRENTEGYKKRWSVNW